MKPIDEKINRGEDWGPYRRNRVQEYIQEQLDSKGGFSPRNLEKEEDGNYHLRVFRDEEAYNEWNSDREAYAENVLYEILIPEMSGGAGTASYVVSLKRDGTGDIITQFNEVKLRLRATSQMYNPITQEREDTGEGVTLTVQTRLNATSAWATKGTIDIETHPADSGGWTTVDLTDMLSTGTQQVRIVAKGQETGASSTYLSFSVTKTTLGLTFATQWEKPITDSVMRLQFYVTGAVSKTVKLLIDGQRSTERNIGTAIYSETPLQIDVTDTDRDAVKVLTHGIHDIEAWISVNDSDVESEHIHCQVMVMANPDDGTPYLILNDVATRLTNWTAAHILSYAIYNPEGAAMPLKFILQDYRGTETYMTIDEGLVPAGVRRELYNSIEIESEQPELSAYMKFLSGELQLHEMIGFELDNSENYAPTPDPDFILNPKGRTNAEENPTTIVNAASGMTLPSTWKGFDLQSDGWVQDAAGQKCLRIPAGRFIDIGYEAFTGFIGTDNRSSLTIEMDVVTKNNTLAVDPKTGKLTEVEDPLFGMCSYLSADGKPLGLELKPTSGVFMTQDKREEGDQNFILGEGTRTHIAVNIIYGINGTDQNYVRIYKNGVIAREFSWEPSDTFVQYVEGNRTSGGIRLGSETCDIDIYGMRIYKKALSSTNIMKDYEASIPTLEKKRAFREANDILGDDGLISFAKASAKYNCLIVKANEIPRYGHNITVEGEIVIMIKDDAAHSGIIKKIVKLKGQGTSSMGYLVWNLSFAEFLEFVNELGETFKGYALDDTVPEATKLVLKVNYASSMQSHKMGSVNLYNDLYHRIIGKDPITSTPGFEKCRVSVKQKPFFVFVQTSSDSEPRFHALGSFGPAKGDKPTFGYDKKQFPDFMLIEGCDNGAPLPGYRIPWNEDITRGGDDGELFMYNGSKNIEIDLGESEVAIEKFKETYNFVYLCNPFIEPFIGTLEDMQYDNSLNKQHFYWVTEASGTTKKFDLFRYDVLTSKWVDAGIKKLGGGLYERLNLSEQLGINPSGVMWEQINRQFVDARVALFKRDVESKTALNLMAFIYNLQYTKLLGLSDNWVKNEYKRYVEETIVPIHDDDDTLGLIDNVGRLKKPYWAEEHDYDENGNSYFNGNESALYNLIEMGYEQECRNMMKTILTEMANLSDDGTAMGCIEKYFLSTQEYFPAVAYNETARLLYEKAALERAAGTYTNETDPLSQSLGSQLDSERAWFRKRLIYMSSYAGYGQFAYNGDGRLSWRSILDSKGRMPEYGFRLTPHMWLYPVVNAGQTSHFGKGKVVSQRVKAGEEYELTGIESDGNTQIQLLGVDYYAKIGDFSDKSLEADFTVSGERLVEFTAAVMPKEFRPTRVAVADSACNLLKFDLEGCASVGGSIAFNNQPRLGIINLKGTSISGYSVKYPTVVKELRLPATLTTLRLVDYTSLDSAHFEIEGASHIQSFVFANCPNLNSQLIVSQMCASEDNDLHEVSVSDIDWVDFPTAYLLKLAAVGADLSGKIKLLTSPTFGEKKALVAAFGDVDDPANKLYLDYTKVYLTSIELTGDSYYGEPGKHPALTVIPNDASGNFDSNRANNFKSMKWSIVNHGSVQASIDERTGELFIPSIGTDVEKPSSTVSVSVECTDGTSLASSMQIWLYHREAQAGDWVYFDGSFSDILQKGKTVVGVCFYVNPDDKTDRLCVACKDLLYYSWGLFPGSWTEGIVLSDAPDYDVFDVPGLNPKNPIPTNNITDETYREGDDFKYQDSACVMSELGRNMISSQLWKFSPGTKLPWGHINTLYIIQHCNKILSDSNVGFEVPVQSTNMSMSNHLKELLNTVINDADKGNGLIKYNEFYYPAAYQCYAYQPAVSSHEVLADCFRQGMWFLPSCGELGRLYWWSTHDELQEVVANGVFVKHINTGIFTALGQQQRWTSSEFSSSYVYGINFTSGFVFYTGGGNKSLTNIAVRPVCAF